MEQPFHLRPSVGTWLTPVNRAAVSVPSAESAAGTAELPWLKPGAVELGLPAAKAWEPPAPRVSPFADRNRYCLRPSVGTWLVRQLDGPGEAWEASDKGMVDPPAVPWKAEFEANFDAFPAPPVMPLTKKGSDAKASPKNAGASEFISFKFAPPPPPAAVCQIGAIVEGAEVVVIEESLKKAESEARRKQGLLLEELVGTNRAEDDDIPLLDDDMGGEPVGWSPTRGGADGVDSPSDSDSEGEAADLAAARAGMQAPESPQKGKLDPQELAAKALAAQLAADGVGANRVPSPKSTPAKSAAQAPAPDVKAAPAAAPAPKQTAKPANSSSPPGVSGGPFSPPKRAPTVEAANLHDIDALVGNSLDKFFDDQKVWQRVESEVVESTRPKPSKGPPKAGESLFKVKVPRPYPGVQYRKSKRLNDRYQRYAEDGATVSGVVEDNGEWLRLAGNLYLPMRVGAVQILIKEGPDEPAKPERAGLSWFSCCTATTSTDAEVLVGDELDDVGNTRGPGGGGGMFMQDQPPHDAHRHSPLPMDEEDVSAGGRLRSLPESIGRNPLSNPDSTNRHFADPINPFADTDRPSRTQANRMSSSPPSGRLRRPTDDRERAPSQAMADDVFQA